MQSSNPQINSIYRINSTRNTRLILCRHLPAVVSHVSKHSTWQNQGSKCPTVFQAPTVAAGFQQFYPAETAFYTATSLHAALTVTPRCNPLDLQGIHLVSTKFIKGSSITLHCNTTRSVCSNLLLLVLRIILQENTRKLILSRYLVILCEEITYYLTSKQS